MTRRSFVIKKPKRAAVLRAKYLRDSKWVPIRVVVKVEGEKGSGK